MTALLNPQRGRLAPDISAAWSKGAKGKRRGQHRARQLIIVVASPQENRHNRKVMGAMVAWDASKTAQPHNSTASRCH
jgi:hypothetical protein